MNESLQRYLASPLLFCIFAPVLILAHAQAIQATNRDEVLPKLTLQVYNYAGAPNSILDHAREVTVRIFEKSGVDLLWLDMGSARPIVLPLGTLAVVIYDRPPYRTRSVDTMGAEMREDLAGVFYDRVGALASDFGTNKSVLMGHVIAHELGHVLHLPHSGTGIMRRSWASNDFWRAATGDLLFAPEESKRIRAELVQQTPQLTWLSKDHAAVALLYVGEAAPPSA